ncbi:MAG: hypothetical protein LJE84_01730 [Gammaproteobacteria bacterium]|nr:hypothetical protein [Gammaproteobacteria bacterium]
MSDGHNWLRAEELPAEVLAATRGQCQGHPAGSLAGPKAASLSLLACLEAEGAVGADRSVAEILFSAGTSGWILSRCAAREFDSRFLGENIFEARQVVAAPSGGELWRQHLEALRDRFRDRARWLLSSLPLEAGVAERPGFARLARKHRYFCPIGNRIEVSAVPTRLRVREARDGDCHRLQTLSSRFQHNQYLALPGVGPDRIRKLYSEWIRLACLGEFADHTLVAEEGERPVGLFAVRIREDIRRLTGQLITGHSLIAVDPGYPVAFPALVNGFQELALRLGWAGAEFDFYEQTASVRRMLERYLCHEVAAWDVFALDLADSVYA